MARNSKRTPVVNTSEFIFSEDLNGGAHFIVLRPGHSSSDFFDVLNSIPGFVILTRNITHQSFGPLEQWEEVTTSLGEFDLEQEFDAGYFTLYSKNKVLMDLIVAQLRGSPRFQEAQK